MSSNKHISQDEIQYIVDVESSKAQQEIHKLEKASASLRAENKARLKQMIEMEARGEKNSKAYGKLKDAYKETGKQIRDLTSKIGDLTNKLDINQLTMKQLKKEAKDLRRNLEDTSKATNPKEYAKLEQRLSEVTGRMSELRQDAKGLSEVLSSDATQGVMMGNVLTKMAEKFGEALRKIKDNIVEAAERGIEMAREADGITRAFKNLNNPNLLDDLRKATKGTVNDIELMKAAVQANDFRIPVENLGKYLQFAQLKAQQTGQSVDYLTNSIITGLGRKSPQILDNLGISSSELREKMAQTGDMASAVSAIVEEQLKKAGNAYVSASDRSAQAAVKVQNAQRALGEELLPLSEQYEETFTKIQVTEIELIRWAVKHREVVAALVVAMAGLTLATLKHTGVLTGNVVATKASAAAHALWNQVTTTTKGLLIVLQSGFYLLTGRLTKAKSEWAGLNTTMKTNLIYLAATAVVALGAAVYTWYKRTTQISQAQRDLNSIQSDAAKKAVEQKRLVNSLVDAMNNENLSMREREAAAKRLNAIIPEYNAHLDKTRNAYVGNKQRLDEYIRSLVRLYEVMGAKEKLVEIGKQRAQLSIEKNQAEKELADARKLYDSNTKANSMIGGREAKAMQMGENTTLSSYKGAVANLNKAIAKLDERERVITKLYGKDIQRQDLQEAPKPKAEEPHGGGYGGRSTYASGNSTNPDDVLAKKYDDARAASLKQWQEFYEKRLQQLKEALAGRQMTQEQYDTEIDNLEMLNASTILSMERTYYDDSEKLSFKDQSKKKELQQRYHGYVETAQKNSDAARLAMEESYYQALDKITESGKTEQQLTLQQQQQAEISILDAYYKTALERAKAFGEDSSAVTAAYEQAKANIIKKYADQKAQEQLQAREKYGLVSDSEQQARDLEAIKEDYDKGLLTHEQYEQAVSNKENEYAEKRKQQRAQLGVERQSEYQQQLAQLRAALAQGIISHEEYEKRVKQIKFDHWKEEFDRYQQLFGGAVSALQDAEMANVDAKYDAEIEAARQAGKDTTDIENKKANEKLKIQKKYADVNFAIKASEIIASTAGAIMKALEQLGPIAGPIAAALMGVTGAAQLAAANAERQKVKRMTLNGSSSSSTSGARVATGLESGGSIDVEREQDGKRFHASYDPGKRGYIDRPTVIVGEGPAGRSKEWVASNAALDNPTVAPLINIIDRAQRAGQISTLDMRKYLMQRQVRGLAGGGSITVAQPSMVTAPSNTADRSQLAEKLYAVLSDLRDNGIPAYVALDEFDAKQKMRDQARRIGSKL